MTNKLKEHFPIIKTKDEIRNYIHSNKKLESIFLSWTKPRQEEFLDFTSGARGVKILYDSFFKEIMNPEYYPDRLNDLLSVILGVNVKIVQVLPTDSTRLGEETSLVVMDIVVQTEDGALINIEMQKIGYRYPGQRSACYSSDLLLRQYKRLRNSSSLQKPFSYKNVKPVYTIIFFENSPRQFNDFPDKFIHRFKQTSDTGLEISLLQKFIFIPLDIYKKMSNNISTKLDAWLTFLGSDNIEDILQLIEKFPEFKPMYETLYRMCLNIEGVMDMFSKELYELDKNTELLMIDELEQEIIEKHNIISQQENTISQLDNTISQLDDTISQQENTISDMSATIASLQAEIEKLKNHN